MAFDDFKRLSTGTSLAEVKVLDFMFTMTSLDSSFFQAAGKWRQEGKSYEMQDGMTIDAARTSNTFSFITETGDMVHFQFNVTKDPKKK